MKYHSRTWIEIIQVLHFEYTIAHRLLLLHFFTHLIVIVIIFFAVFLFLFVLLLGLRRSYAY